MKYASFPAATASSYRSRAVVNGMPRSCKLEAVSAVATPAAAPLTNRDDDAMLDFGA